MIKKFTLIALLISFLSTTVYSSDFKIAFLKDQALTDKWVTIKAFSGLEASDWLIIRGSGRIRIAYNTDETTPVWTEKAGTFDLSASNDGILVELTSAEIAGIKKNGIQLAKSGDAATITSIGYGSLTSGTELLTGDVTTDTGIGAFSCSVGDKLIATYILPTAEGSSVALVKNGGDWSALSGWPNYTWVNKSSTKTSFIIDITSDMQPELSTNGILLKTDGGKTKYTSLKLISANDLANTYILNTTQSTDDYISVANLPNTAIDVILNRNFAWGWNSICLPFDADVTAIDPSDATAYEFTAGSSTNITVTSITGTTMNAGVPYLVYVDKAGVTSATFSNVTVTETTPSSVGPFGSIALQGNYTAGFSMSGKFGVAYSETTSRWEIMRGGLDSKLPAFCAYFSTTMLSRGFGIETNDGTTGINTFEVNDIDEDGPIYNMMGQQIMAPRKGIYIKNGKKYIAK